jgi:hypothetical protein
MLPKTTIAMLLVLALATSAAAQPPLPPGRPAGSKNAQSSDNQAIFVGVGLLTIGIGVYLASGDYKTPVTTVPPTTSP